MQGNLVETRHGKYHRYEITKKSHVFSGPTFLIYRDGSFWKSRNSLAEAVGLCR